MATFNANAFEVRFTQPVAPERDAHSGLLTGRIRVGEMQSVVHKLSRSGKTFASFSIVVHPRVTRLLQGSPVEWMLYRSQRRFSRN